MTFVLIGLGWVLAVVVFLSLAVAAADGDRIADRLRGSESDDDFELSVASAMYDYTIYGRWHP